MCRDGPVFARKDLNLVSELGVFARGASGAKKFLEVPVVKAVEKKRVVGKYDVPVKVKGFFNVIKARLVVVGPNEVEEEGGDA